ncbi:MAG: hypothetical protein LDLANPLL_01009 [Turneriella sp.]|nr:hypothetical protein [Turneriella sp.]
MGSLTSKILTGFFIIVFFSACAPKRVQTQFAKNKMNEAGQNYTPDQLRTALGSHTYDTLVTGIGADNLNLISYGIGISNITALLNLIDGPGKLVALLSDGPNSKQLKPEEVVGILNKLDAACQNATLMPNGNDTIKKMARMINGVTVAGMEGIKNIVHGVRDQPADKFGVTTAMNRLGMLVALLNENASPSIMAVLINNVAAPGGSFSATGTAKLIRMVNDTHDLWNLYEIIDKTTSISNITDVMLGLNGNIYCSKPEHTSQTACTAAGGTWTNTNCSTGTPSSPYTTQSACIAAGGSWTSDGIENMTQVLNQLATTCTSLAYTNAKDCRNNGETWHTIASKVPVIVNNIAVVPNMYTIVNNLTNDGQPYVAGSPDGVDIMVATLNNVYNASMGDTGTYAQYGLNGVKRLAYMVNQLDQTPVFSNDTNFDDTTGGFNCTTGNFNNYLNWAFTDNGPAAVPWNNKSWVTGGAPAQAGPCSLRNDNSPATISTATQSAELIANLTAAGNLTFYTKTDTLEPYDILRVFIDDTMVGSWTKASGGSGFQPRSIAIGTGIKRIRFDVQRIPNSSGQVFIDTVVLPGDKGAPRTAAEKTAILMNNLYIQSSVTNVADLLNNTTATATPAGCWNNTPINCIPTNDNGLDALIYAANRSEYPGGAGGAGIKDYVTISYASPAKVTWFGHSLANGTAIKLTSSGTLPNPLVTNTVYYVKNAAANNFELALTPSSPSITTSTAGSGIHMAISQPRLAVTVNEISNLSEMYAVLNNLTTYSSYQQLVALMDYVEIPRNVPLLINGLGTGGGAKTASILTGLTAAGTSNMLRTLAEPANDGANISDVADLINGATTTSHVAVALSKLTLSGNIYMGKYSAVTADAATDRITWSGHNYREQSPVDFDTTGTLPLPLKPGKKYYMLNATANDFQVSLTPGGAAIDITTTGSGTHTAYSKGELFYDGPTLGASGGKKFAQFFSAVNAKAAAMSQNCTGTPGDINSNFCIKFHFVRIVNDLAGSGYGPTTIAQIVGNLRPDNGVGGYNGIERMTDALYDMKTMATPVYNNALSNATADQFGRMTTLMTDMGANGPLNMARMVNELSFGKLTSSGTWLVKNTNRIRYFSRTMSEMTSADLMIRFLDHPVLQPSRVNTLVNTHGDATYGTGALGSYDGDTNGWYGENPSGAGCTTTDCDTNTTDKLGRLIQMINNIEQIPNTVYFMVYVQDIGYASYLIDNLTRIRYMTDIVNNLTNVDLMVKVMNGADACSVYVQGINTTTDDSTTCASAGGTWFGVGRCTNFPTQTTRAACLAAGGGTGIWEGADRVKMLALLNGLGTSRMKGGVDNVKNVGDMATLSDVVNKLGYNGASARSTGQQVRVVRLMNAVEKCGLRPAYDKYIQYGPTCINSSNVVQNLAYQYPEACTAAGYLWRAKQSKSAAWQTVNTIYYDCDDQSYQKPTQGPSGGGYYNNNDPKDGRYRLLQSMLEVNDGTAFSYIVGDVQDTQKTIDMMNATRRLRAITQLVNWQPGAVTAALINETHPAAVNRSLVYMTNNLDDDEDETAKAFASMIHFGTRIVPQGADSGAPSCLEFTAIGPRRLAALLNLEAGPYLEGLLSALGWQMSIAAMNCGWARDDDENNGSCPAVSWSDGSDGGLRKSVGSSYSGLPAPTATQCIRPKETLTDGATTYRYGYYTWSSGTQGVRQPNCQSIMPKLSGGSFGINKVTDEIIWGGLTSIGGNLDDGLGSNGCTGSCSDMWSMLKGTGSGILGWAMGTDDSYVGFPDPKGFNNTAPLGGSSTYCTDESADNNDNWQCIREGLQAGDLGAVGSYGAYWGTFCSGAGTSSSGQAMARSCITNGGTWKTQKNYQSSSCTVDFSGTPTKVGP